MRRAWVDLSKGSLLVGQAVIGSGPGATTSSSVVEQDGFGSLKGARKACRQLQWRDRRTNCMRVGPVGMRCQLTLADRW